MAALDPDSLSDDMTLRTPEPRAAGRGGGGDPGGKGKPKGSGETQETTELAGRLQDLF